MAQKSLSILKQRKGISTTIAAVLIVIALIVGLAGGYYLVPLVTTTQTKLNGVINIGAALPLTGGLATYAQNGKNALILAKNQINALLNSTNAGYSINLLFEDTQTLPNLALTATQDLASKGCQVILGYYSSGELSNCMTYAQTNQIVLISPSSTAVSLAIPKHYIYRFVPADDKQGPAMAKAIFTTYNISYIVPIWRGDTYGDGLVSATESRFVQLGGNYDHNGIRYDYNALDFSSEVALLATEVQNAVNANGANRVGVYAVTFEEIEAIMTSASSYPILSQVKWFGCDGSALSGKLKADTTAANFAMNTTFPATYFAPTNSSNLIQVRDYVQSQTGNIPDPYSYDGYDSLWAVAKAIGLTQQYSGAAIDKVLPTIANLTFGASGWTALNQFNDRTIGDYQFWQVYKVNATAFDWRLAGLYTAGTDSVTLYP